MKPEIKKRLLFSSIILLIIIFIPASSRSENFDGQTESETTPEVNDEISPDERFHELLIRENETISMHEGDGDIKLSLLSSDSFTSKKIAGEDHFEVRIPIGSSAPVICYTAEKNSDVPHAYLKSFFDHMDKNEQIEKRGLKTLNANLIQDLPYIYMETEYVTNEKKYGRVKSMAFSILGNTFFCFHDELGYNKTFIKVVSSFAQSDFVRDFKKKYSNYHEKQIDLIYLNGIAVGFFENYEFEDDEANRNLITISSLIIPRSDSDLVGLGTVTNISVDKYSGEVKSEGHYSYINNEVNHELQLTRMDGRKYRIKGVFSGKEVDNIFETKAPLMSSSFLIKDFLKRNNDNASISFEEYSPVSPLGSSVSSIVKKGLQDDGTTLLEYTIHSKTYNFNMDKNGYKSLRMSMGPVRMTLKRSYYDKKN